MRSDKHVSGQTDRGDAQQDVSPARKPAGRACKNCRTRKSVGKQPGTAVLRICFKQYENGEITYGK